ncbi:TRAP transporter small permease [Seohaeicola zhoushanensis]|nr:TRAP transporter small permease [Seohaeicola zhoushanensis]
MQKTATLVTRINRFTTVLGGLAIALMMLHITADVAGRYLFNTSLPGTITIVSNYYMVVAVFLPLALAEEEDAHISVEVFTAGLGETGQRIIAIITLFVSLAVCMLFTGKTWEEAIRQMESGAAVLQGNSTVTIWPSNFLLPIGFGLMVIVLIIKLIGYLSRSARSPFLPDFTRLDPVENFND